MGKLLTGRYGQEPEAESIPITLKECNQKLGLKPSDFVSAGAPAFFRKNFGTGSRYLLFLLEPEEAGDGRVWKAGYYLLPLDALDVLKAFGKGPRPSAAGPVLPVEVESEETPPPLVQQRIDRWIARSQPLFFQCGCNHLELQVKPPWGIRRQWKVRLRCPGRCQPPLIDLL